MRHAVIPLLALAGLLVACNSPNSATTVPGSRAGAPVTAAAASLGGTTQPAGQPGPAPPSQGAAPGVPASAQDLLNALLSGTIPGSLLPQGFSAPMPTQAPLTAVETKHQALGKVVIGLTGPDTQDEVAFTVYPAAADASARWKEPLQVASSETLASHTTPAGFTQPALLLSGTVSSLDSLGQTSKAGFMSCFVLVGNVEVAAASVSTANAASGNVATTLALAKAGIAYLTSLAGQ